MGMDKERENDNRHGGDVPEVAAKSKSEAAKQALVKRILKIGRECAGLPVFDKRKPEDMLYDKLGLPK